MHEKDSVYLIDLILILYNIGDFCGNFSPYSKQVVNYNDLKVLYVVSDGIF